MLATDLSETENPPIPENKSSTLNLIDILYIHFGKKDISYSYLTIRIDEGVLGTNPTMSQHRDNISKQFVNHIVFAPIQKYITSMIRF